MTQPPTQPHQDPQLNTHKHTFSPSLSLPAIYFIYTSTISKPRHLFSYPTIYNHMFQNSLPKHNVCPDSIVSLPYCTVYAATLTLYEEHGNKFFSTTDVLFVVSSPFEVSFDFA